jgi:diguanylate cyclase (GGDEF)-like protein
MIRPEHDKKLGFKPTRLSRSKSKSRARFVERRQSDIVERLQAELAQKQDFIEQQAAILAHSRKIFDRSSVAARLGVWECNLPDNRIAWTDVIYDIFDLPRDLPLERDLTVNCYSLESQIELDRRRSKAIAERSGFTMDAEIVTARGNRRWIRITATVECEDGEPVRIFGIKQDITDEKLLQDQTRYLASFDVVTGLANRAQFQSKLAELCEPGHVCPDAAALMLIDLDGFKKLNDTFGHAAGDHCLQEAARRFAGICGRAGLVARIGGDEFAVLLDGGADVATLVEMAGEIVAGLQAPIPFDGAHLQVSASLGIAFAGGETAGELFKKADAALYAAKAAGRNTFRFSAGDYPATSVALSANAA